MTVSEIEYGMTELYREKIMEVGAYRTGNLYNSIETVIAFTSDGPIVRIMGINYLPFVDNGTRYIDPRYITEKWLADPRYDVMYEELFVIWFEQYQYDN